MKKLQETSIQYLKGIGPKKAKSFNKSGIDTIEDLLYYFPRRYEDRTNFILISQLKEGQNQIIKYALYEYLPKINDFIPYDIRARNNLLNLAKSLRFIHFPDNFETQKEVYRRLSFEEFFLFQLPLALRKLKKKKKIGISHRVEGELVNNFMESLPFALTASQKRVIEEIKSDMAKPLCMQRLLQGDVGSGKTVVATIAAVVAIQGGYQAAILVPTEILAKQHFEKIKYQSIKVSKYQEKEISIGLLIGSAQKKEKERLYKEIKEGKIDLVIGTHALLEEDLKFKSLGLVVIDEQHKFGVGQRALLPKKGSNPDILIMTATPIPRTLAITLYGDLDISVINELPLGRKPISTQRIGSDRKDWLYSLIKENIRSGRQVYVIYPIIEESFALDLLSAKKMYAEFKHNIFPEFNVDLIHGRLKQTQQDRIMSEFREGRIQILIATTVLEVGIDVANATVMVIEHAERFGLSQLHQLRGRIGRGPYASVCILVSNASSPEAKARLSAMVSYSDGFRIAEEDLKIRGPGEFFGKRQHGLTELKIANPLTQMQLLKRAREEAIKVINTDSRLEARQNVLLKEKLLQRFPEYEKLMVVG